MKDSDGLGFFEILGLIFITLKLTDFIDWWWIWVLAPIWGKYILGLLISIILLWKKK